MPTTALITGLRLPGSFLDEAAFLRTLRRATLWPAVALGVALALLFALTLYLFHSAEWVDHTDRVIAQAFAVEKLAVDLETGLRGYQLTGEPDFLQPWENARRGIGPALETLATLVADNPAQTTALAGLRAALARWQAHADETLARVRAGEEVRDVASNAQGKAMFDAFRERTARFSSEEEKLRNARALTLLRLRNAVFVTLALTALAGIPLLVGTLRRLVRRVSGAYRGALTTTAAQREELRTALRSIGDAVIATDATGAVAFLNPVAEALCGWSDAESRGRSLAEVLPIFNERSGAPAENPVERVLRERVVIGMANHTVLRPRSGGEIPIEDSAAPIFAEDGSLRGVILVFRDVTEKLAKERAAIAEKERAEALARAAADDAERFRVLAETVSLQVWTATPDGALDWANHYVASYFGVVDLEREVLGSAWTRLVHPEDLPEAASRWAHALATGERYEMEFRLRDADDNYRWFLVRAEGMRDETGAVVKWFGTNTEIDALKVAQSSAEAASRAKDNFLAALSHELRTPLTPVLMTADALREDPRLPPDVREQLGMMERNIALEARLIDDLLDLTRITQGKLPLRPQLCDAHSLISLAVEIVRDDALAKGISIERDFSAVLSGLTADPARFQQVIWNLLRNSVKFTPRGGRISIRTANAARNDETPRLLIEVSDSGIGIEGDAIDRIFRPFEQAGVTGDHRFGGLGLGLAIARAIVDLHGGTIRAKSEGAGRGATFTIELPEATAAPHGVADTLPRALPTHGSPSNGGAERSLRLLLVEDHEATLEVLTRLLTRAGHSVVTAASVSAALAAADHGNFDAVISDLGLPDGTGTELMTQLRERHGLRGIALSGYGMEQDMERTRAAGFITHLVKPVDFNQLRRTLEMLG